MSDLEQQFVINFWGVRGSIPCPGAKTARYGGNTPCVEMVVGGERLIFDGGTGLRVLGQSLLAQMPVEGHIFFTHTHWDHIQGFPFFTPAFNKSNSFKIYGVPTSDGITIKQRLHNQMLHPNFPVPLQIMQADLKFFSLDFGETLTIKDVVIETAKLNHPGESTGYRISWRGISVAYVTDTEHFQDHVDDQVLKLARDADVVIIDGAYTDEEYYDPKSGKVGWGHSTWQEAIKVAKQANAKQLVIFHHDPLHDDDFLDQVAAEAAVAFPRAILAREGLSLTLIPAKLDSTEEPKAPESLLG